MELEMNEVHMKSNSWDNRETTWEFLSYLKTKVLINGMCNAEWEASAMEFEETFGASFNMQLPETPEVRYKLIL